MTRRTRENFTGDEHTDGFDPEQGRPRERYGSRPLSTLFGGTKRSSDEAKALGFDSISEMLTWKENQRKAAEGYKGLFDTIMKAAE